ncbi:hypothetical protein RND71_017143 [Anisodus tanguticus]|uniref:PRONE domain-containing protein n=1 Tax=Anisodus tanguticus TaxID=243964 RepID=A0AAE1S277_9SOLA|nr:hypothetical protein RND71_017143 [Anisodus tanguticus]
MVRAVEEEKIEIQSSESQNINGWKHIRKETIKARNKADDSAPATINQNNPPSGKSSSFLSQFLLFQEKNRCVENVVTSFLHSFKDMKLMKEKFAKLLLGEDMSGGGKGVSSALALSNAITNLAASAFGEQKRLEPMQPETKAKWRKEIDWLLSVTDYIVEFVPSKQKSKDGTIMEIMVTKQRTDLQMNIPALRKLDAMLLDCLDSFKDQSEISYTSKDDEGKNSRKDDKWWIPTPKVPPNGLSDATRKWLQFQKDSVNQNGRASLGDSIYRSITDEFFNPDYFLSTMDLSSEHKILDLKNRIEASVIIWRRKMNAKDGKSAWSSAISMEKRELFEERAETILLILKHRFPGIPQSSLDISKIQYNRDIGQAILESYSRIIESRAFTVMSRIDDVLQADDLAQNPSNGEVKRFPIENSLGVSDGTFQNDKEEVEKLNSAETPNSMTLLDFIGWGEGDDETEKDVKEDRSRESDGKLLSKHPNTVSNKRVSYLENLAGSRSPTARH